MSLTLEQVRCNHDLDENSKCKKCGIIDYFALTLKRIELEDMMISNQWEACKVCGKPKCYVIYLSKNKEILVCKDRHKNG